MNKTINIRIPCKIDLGLISPVMSFYILKYYKYFFWYTFEKLSFLNSGGGSKNVIKKLYICEKISFHLI
jgi:hypothetical protein